VGTYFLKLGFHEPSLGFGSGRLVWSIGERLVSLLVVRKLARVTD
jgi:hypothetical protein